MKKTITLFAIPFLAGCVVAMALHQSIGYAHIVSVDQLDHEGTNIIHGVLGFFFGFLPSLIYGLAIQWKEENEPLFTPELQTPEIFEGLTLAFPSSNCVFRVKAVNVRGILEHYNPDMRDYL